MRILTNRNFPDGKSKEWIEKDEEGRFMWKADDYSMKEYPNGVGCGFVVDEEFVKEKFLECGRVYDSKR